jgi:hypothetical protein
MFPLIEEGTLAWSELLGSIQHFGQLEPIVIDGDILIDGRNRLRACQKLNIAPRSVEWSSLGITISQGEWIGAKNLERRHLTDDQRATITAKVMGWLAVHEGEEEKRRTQFKEGNPGPQKTVRLNTGEPSRDFKGEHSRSTAGKVSQKAGVSRHKAEQAVAVQKHSPELAEEVIKGKITLLEAKRIIDPISEPKQIAEHEPEDDDSDGLWKLKQCWRKANKKEKAEFIKWIEELKA